jgi:methionyl-tRNA formyltransferase
LHDGDIALAREALGWRRRRRQDRALGGAAASVPSIDEYPIHALNSDAGLALLQSLEPDYLAVCGTGLLQPRIFETARRGTLNLHLGLSPRYRGSHCVFWPLFNGEPEWIGITIHYLNRGIDAGPILAQRRPAVEAADDVESLVHKSLDLAIETMSGVLQRVMQQHLEGVPQRLSEGRNYNARELTPEKQAELTSRLEAGYLARYLTEHGGRMPEVPLINAGAAGTPIAP